MRFLFLVSVSFISIFSFAQVKDSIRIKGFFLNNSRYTNVIFTGFGSDQQIIKKNLIKDSVFNMALPLDIRPGVYRLIYSQSEPNSYVDIIINGLEGFVAFSLDVNQKETVVFNESDSNKNWHGYLAASKNRLLKIEMLSEFWMGYPDRGDKILSSVGKSIEKEKSRYKKEHQDFIKENRGTWQAGMVANMPYYFTDLRDMHVLQDYDRRNHYWDNIDTMSEDLLHTPLYTDHILKYLSYYMNPQMHFSEQEMEEGFKKSSDTIMAKFAVNEKAQKFALQYLTKGFKEIGQEKVLQYLDQKYSDIALRCQDDQEKAAFERRLAGYELLKKGVKAPPIDWYDKDGKLKNLNDISSDKVLVVFWASWCVHCQRMMPALNQFAMNNSDIKVLAVSLDEDEKSFMQAGKDFNNMLHFCDFRKWNSVPAVKYNIVATPTFILLDKERRMIDRYTSFEAVKIDLDKM